MKKHGKIFGVKKNIQNHFFGGVLLIMPFGITLLVMRWLFGWMAGFLKPPFLALISHLVNDPTIKTEPPANLEMVVSILSILILIFLVYIIGLIGHYVLGKRLLAASETIILKIPLVKTIYSATKQVMNAISLPDRAAFQSVVLVEFPRPGFKAIGFSTGLIKDSQDKQYCKVFIPTSPNPTTGFFEMVPIEEIVEIQLAVEDALKLVISGGILSPDKLNLKNVKSL